jgi:hypothetical protein
VRWRGVIVDVWVVWLGVIVDLWVVWLGVIVDVWVVWRRASELDLVGAIVDNRRSSVDVLRH